MGQRHHRRNRIGIPRGLLHHLALVLLRSGPKSGSELTEEIEEYTDWRPSPGSIYPLLSNLQEKGFIEPHEDGEAGIKRFKLTRGGLNEVNSHPHHEEEFRKRNRTIRKMYWRLLKGMPKDVYESFAGIIDSLESTWDQIDDNQVTLFKEILDNTKAELLKLGKKQDE
jgi:DNA-binding PadR family transcriptional regulator